MPLLHSTKPSQQPSYTLLLPPTHQSRMNAMRRGHTDHLNRYPQQPRRCSPKLTPFKPGRTSSRRPNEHHHSILKAFAACLAAMVLCGNGVLAAELSLDVDPWTTPASQPAAGTAVTVRVHTHPSTANLVLGASPLAVINGQDVSATFATVSSGVYSLTYTTAGGDENWPWSGLFVEVALFTSGGAADGSISQLIVPGSSFTEESSARGFTPATSAQGTAFADVDGDGDFDVFVCHDSGTDNFLYINDGTGQFTEEGVARGVAGSYSAYRMAAATFADVDGDGDMDLLLASYDANAALLFINDGSGYFSDEGGTRGFAFTTVSRMIAAGDVDGDGHVDLFVSTKGVADMMMMNDGTGFFTDEAASRGLDGSLNDGIASTVIDIDGDMQLDVVVCNLNANDNLYTNNGGGYFTDVTTARGFGAPGPATHSIIGADFDGDGFLELVRGGSSVVDNFLVRTSTSDAYTDEASTIGFGGLAEKTHGFAAVDVNIDGVLDLFASANSLATHLWMSNLHRWEVGGPLFNDAASVFGTADVAASQQVVAADIDGDGDLDVVIPRAQVMYINSNARTSVTNWIKVRPLTAMGAQSAFGAVVRAYCVSGTCSPDAGGAGGWQATRVIDGSSGYQSQSGYDAVFGLPDPAGSYNFSVRWPGDAHPEANWTTRDWLGGVTPSVLSPSERLLTVRTWSGEAYLVTPDPWDYAAIHSRAGESQRPPMAGDVVTINIMVPGNEGGLVIPPGSNATVNGFDVAPTFWDFGGGAYAVTYITQTGDESWPWTGLDVSLTLSDYGGTIEPVISLQDTFVVGSTFSNDPTAHGIGSAGSGVRGLALGDVNGDGHTDILMPRSLPGQPHRLLMNDGTGYFSNDAVARGIALTGDCRTAAFGDVDNDGDLDAYIGCGNTADQLFINNGTGYFHDGAASFTLPTEFPTTVVAFADLNGDQFVDVVLGSSSSTGLLINNGGVYFSNETSSRSLEYPSDVSSVLIFDFDDDSDLDVFVSSTLDTAALFVNNGAGFFSEMAASYGFDVTNSYGAVASDISLDGNIDVLLQQSPDGKVLIRQPTGHAIYMDFAAGLLDTPLKGRYLSAGDLDLDGRTEIWTLLAASDDLVFAYDSQEGLFVDRSSKLGLNASVSSNFALADFDSDGDLDAFVTGGDYYENFNASPDRGTWLRVRPLTAYGAPSAFGAVVTVVCVTGSCSYDPWAASRVIDGGGNRGVQGQYEAHFGLPDETATYDVSIRWPLGLGPASNYSTNPELGSIVPSELSAASRLLVVTPAVTPIPSPSPSATGSATPSATLSATASASASATTPPSSTSTASSTRTASPTKTASPSRVPSVSPSAPPSPSASSSRTASPSPWPSMSPSSSPLPVFHLEIQTQIVNENPRRIGKLVATDADGVALSYSVGLATLSDNVADVLTIKGHDGLEVALGPHDMLSGTHIFNVSAVVDSDYGRVPVSQTGLSASVVCGGVLGPTASVLREMRIIARVYDVSGATINQTEYLSGATETVSGYLGVAPSAVTLTSVEDGSGLDGTQVARLVFNVLHLYADIPDGAEVAVSLRSKPLSPGAPTSQSIRQVGYLWQQLGSAASASSGAGCFANH